jgi:DNA (cytosine-5)-methyltransferase 1
MIIDLFAGGGGASLGIEAATGRHVDVAINHSATALAVHAANHPRTKHLTTDIWEVEPKAVTRGRKVELLWASPDCTHFSVAKGGKPREKGIRSLAWVVVEWARKVRPARIFIENVAEFRTWGPLGADDKPDRARMGETFEQWRGALEILGYVVDHRVLDASLYGAPTKRKRLFLVARCDGQPIRWPEATHGPGRLPLRTAAECIDWSLPVPSIFTRTRPLAEPTLRRIAAGIKHFVIDTPTPFVRECVAPTMVQTGYGERAGQRPRFLDLHEPLGTVMGGGAKHALVAAFLVKHYGGTWRRRPGSALTEPISTITGRDHHGLVCALLERHDVGDPVVMVHGEPHTIVDIGMRMLAPHELLRAQFGRFAEGYDMSAATTQAAKVKLIGNSVAPEVAEALVAANLPRAQRRAA